jgi:tetratricopeptide (TPR) repeat protein
MIRRLLILSLSVVLLSPTLLRAQQAQSSVAGSTADAKMYEDIEIMRRILDRKLHSLYATHLQQGPIGYSIGNTYQYPSSGGFQGGLAGMQGGMMGSIPLAFQYPSSGGFQGGLAGMQGGMMGNIPLATTYVRESSSSLEGVYLKGQGVIYTATLSSLQAPARAETAPPISEWESVRQQLHHEKENPKRAETAKPPELADVLLKVLADNGHHFMQLADNESLTIILTVRGTGATSTGRKSTGQPAKTGSQPPAGGEGDTAIAAKVHDLELLADLHLKQGRYEEALTTLHKAVEMNPGPRKAATLYRKLAQCYLAMDQNEKAKAAVDRSIASLKEAADSKDKPASAGKTSAVALPVKMIISVPRRLLDRASAGKLSAEEFRRMAHVETLTFDGDRR